MRASKRPTKPAPPPTEEGRISAPPPSSRRSMLREPAPGSMPGTLLIGEGAPSRVFLIDYDAEVVAEKELVTVEQIIPYLVDERPSITWIDVRGIADANTFHRLGEIFQLHPLALEDVVNVPQRPKTDAYPDQ